MALKQPESMEELVYFTKRNIGEGFVKAWVFREKCPKCGKGLMGKPKDKTGKVKVRATYYECPECKYTIPKKEYEESLTVNISYICPNCKYEGETQIPFKRKKIKGVDALVFHCEKCKEKILITKKMKELKK